MQLSSITAVAIEEAFKDFSHLMMTSEHFRVIFDSQQQMEALILQQADNFYQSLSMSDQDFKVNFCRLGLSYAKRALPFEIMVAAFSLARDNLLKNTAVQPSELYTIIEKMEGYLAKGYLVYQFEDVLSQLELASENIKRIYTEDDFEVVMRPISWLKRIVSGFQEDKILEHADILTADFCPLTPLINALDVEIELKQRILISHTEQHALALNMAFFFRQEDYMLANFMFSRLFATTISLSNQIGLAVSHQAIEELQYDALTGLLLRHSLEQKFQETASKNILKNQSIAIIMLDVDHFKNINDSWGHSAGDKVLTLLGELVKSNQRENDFAFRYGGEEFLILLSNVSFENSHMIAERIRQQVEVVEVQWQGALIPLTLSIGVVHIDARDLSGPLESYIEQADQNLYQAKDSGRNRVVITRFKPA
ncbi:MAG: diguanylate cyclase [Pseudomonadota bacterium]